MKRNLLKLTSVAVFLLVMVPAMVNAQSGKTNFSGTWTMNAEKSNLGNAGGGGGRGFGGGNFVAKQDGNTLTVERTMNRQGQEMTMTSTYSLDGKETTSTAGGGMGGESKSIAKWSADGKSLTITTKRSFNGNERTSTEIWSLKDASTLSITSKRQDRDGNDVETTRVYDKGAGSM
jgi:hypothetical protein